MLKSIFKWRTNNEIKKQQSSFLYIFLIKVLEDVVFWKKWWLSLLVFSCFNIVFALCVYREINLLQFVIGCSLIILLTDAFESWLKYKHRTTCLKRLGDQNIEKILLIGNSTYSWCEKVSKDFLYLRNINHTKAFILLQITFTIIFLLGKYFNGYVITYTLCTLLLCHHKLLSHVKKCVKKMQQNAESDVEFEGLLPEASDANLDLLTFEPEKKSTYMLDDKQSLDFWKPDDLPLEEVSDDSSDNSSSMVTNLAKEKMHPLTKDIEGSDSSEDEYIPHQDQQPELVQTTMEVYPMGTWSNAAYNMFTNIGGAMAHMVYNPGEDKKRKRVSSVDSSDGFEMIDKNDVL